MLAQWCWLRKIADMPDQGMLLADSWCHQHKRVSDCIHVLLETQMFPHVFNGVLNSLLPCSLESLAAPSVRAQGPVLVPPHNANCWKITQSALVLLNDIQSTQL